VEISLRLRDFQAQWKSPALGLFRGAAFSTALLPPNCAVDPEFEGQRLRGLEQNPKTSSRWAQLAREGKKVMQFLSDRRYIANVVDGKVQFYGRGGDRALNGSERK